MMDCTGSRSGRETSTSTSSARAKASVKAASSSSGSSDDIHMAQTLAEMMTSDRQSLLALQQGACVKLDYSLKSDKQDDQIFHVDCKAIDGTIEVIAGKGDSEKNYDITTDLTYTDDSSSSRVDNSFYTIKILKDKTEHISKDFSESFTSAKSAFELNGTSTYVFTPDKDSQDDTTGKVEIESTIYFSKNQNDLKYFDVASFGLHKSACGLDSGVLSMSNADVTYQITYSGCGSFKIKETKATETTALY